MDARLIDGAAHQAIERIDFPDQVTLAQATDRGVTGHFTHRLPLVSHQPDLCPQPRSGGRSLRPSVPTADDNHVEAQARGQGLVAGVEFVKQLLKGESQSAEALIGLSPAKWLICRCRID